MAKQSRLFSLNRHILTSHNIHLPILDTKAKPDSYLEFTNISKMRTSRQLAVSRIATQSIENIKDAVKLLG